MGFFSWNCKRCGESVKAPYNIPQSLAWQNRVVALTPNGSTFIGMYDGYGRIVGEYALAKLSSWEAAAEVNHYDCWIADKDQFWYWDASVYAEDQGFFYDRPTGEMCVDLPFPENYSSLHSEFKLENRGTKV